MYNVGLQVGLCIMLRCRVAKLTVTDKLKINDLIFAVIFALLR